MPSARQRAAARATTAATAKKVKVQAKRPAASGSAPRRAAARATATAKAKTVKVLAKRPAASGSALRRPEARPEARLEERRPEVSLEVRQEIRALWRAQWRARSAAAAAKGVKLKAKRPAASDSGPRQPEARPEVCPEAQALQTWKERAQRAEEQVDRAEEMLAETASSHRAALAAVAQRHRMALAACEQRHQAALTKHEQRRRANEQEIRELVAESEAGKVKAGALKRLSNTLETTPSATPNEQEIRELVAESEAGKVKAGALKRLSNTLETTPSAIPPGGGGLASIPIAVDDGYKANAFGDRWPPPPHQTQYSPAPGGRQSEDPAACPAPLSWPELLAKRLLEKNDVSLEAVEMVLQSMTVPFSSLQLNRFLNGQIEVRGLTFGLCSLLGSPRFFCGSRGALGICTGTYQYPWLTKLLAAAVRAQDAEFRFTGIYLDQDYAMQPHVDRDSAGQSYIVGLGDYEGGELWLEDSEGKEPLTLDEDVSAQYPAGTKFRGRLKDVRRHWTSFDQSLLHYTRPFIGTRYTLVYFTCNGFSRVPQETREALTQAGLDFPWDSPDLRDAPDPRAGRADRSDDQSRRQQPPRAAKRPGPGRPRRQQSPRAAKRSRPGSAPREARDLGRRRGNRP